MTGFSPWVNKNIWNKNIKLKKQVLIAGYNVFSSIVFPYLDIGVGVGGGGVTIKNQFSYFSAKTNVGTQKYCISEMLLLSTENTCFN